MKNKKIEQTAARKRHKERLKADRRKEPTLERGYPELIEKPSILIVCEGENTEPSYFNQFKVTSATVKSVGTGYNTVSLVEKAKKIDEMLKPFHVEYDGGDTGCKIVSEDFFDILVGTDKKSHRKRVDLAIDRAERIYERLDHFSPAKEESSTTVFRLVRELIKYA